VPEYRRPARFAAARSIAGRMAAYPATYWAALRGRGFYERLQTRDGFAPARRFAMWTVAMTSILLVALLVCADNLYSMVTRQPVATHWRDLPGVFLAGIWLALGLLGLIGLALLAVSRFGWRPVQPRAVACSIGLPGCCCLGPGAWRRWLRSRGF
jgi:hypothetical protein